MKISLHAIFLILFPICCSQVLPVDGISIIKPGDQLNSTSTLVSEGGNFTLGFFTIPETNFSYLGIWYTADYQRRKGWVANPNSPINMNSSGAEAQLTMDSTGSLGIFSGGNPVLNVADQVVTNNNTIAVLLDSGNFVLMDSGSGNRTLWQSFDHPTDSLLPGMKLGFNLTTGQNWTLSSPLSSYILGSGAFTMSLERTQDSGQIVIRRRGEVYWTSGPWNNQGFPFFSKLNASFLLFAHKLNFASADDGMYFSFETIGTAISMLTLNPDGTILDDANSFFVNSYDQFCYGYEKDNGCATSKLPTCRSNKDTFKVKSGGFIGGDINYDPNSNISLSDCMERCWNDCNCRGFNTGGNNDTGCITWTNNKLFQVDESGRAVQAYVLVAVKSSEEEEKRLRDQYIHQLTASESFKNVDEMEKTEREGDLNFFNFGSIMAATKGFSAQNKLGEGGFGPVFKGKLLDGRDIAVKRLSKTSGQGLVEFKNELILISKLQHTNLVRVLGCCIHEEEKMLIYEYMPNKSLDFFLFAEDKKEQLDWEKRFSIIEGIAQGLLYLHKYSRMRVIHRDLKASNVLLDENMNPKIADFGMAKIFKQNETEAMTNRVVGTYGYMAPEYAMEGAFSIKSDVFSFGVLILEIVSGRRNSNFHLFDEERPLNLIGYAWELWKEGVALELKDPAIGDLSDIKQLLRSIHVGLLCVQESATDRPTMSEVVSMLNNESMSLAAPKKPAYFTGRRDLNLNSTSCSSTIKQAIFRSQSGNVIFQGYARNRGLEFLHQLVPWNTISLQKSLHLVAQVSNSSKDDFNQDVRFTVSFPWRGYVG
ncbi:OLC1v1001023C2 [Oldenlandia corymbosa var. corymbosa]|uniref:Receptor-like serine/threonine-protein kinase n=2 Tax=Oldenlandia corymbosa var. corymbosa TaxID=529605 RepID=A0AAV1D559_OLDCO|nr:OLC1v1001023C2 [Oldenlandia corymbosa var. corymbosa]